MIRAQIVVDGIVQGVGFRWFAMKLARNYNLNGWVRNRMRGDVEIVVEGERETIEEFIQDIKSGPNYGRVDAVDVEWKQATGQFHSFTIAR